MSTADCVSVLAGTRVAVTGGAGFIGSHAVDALIAAGAHVLVLDDLSTGRCRNVGHHASSGCVILHLCDIRSGVARRLLTTFRPRIVVHLAARVSVADAMSDPLTDSAINVCGTVSVLQTAASAGADKVIFACSSAVYGQVDPNALPVGDEHPLAPVTPYAISKAAALSYVEWFARERGVGATSLMLGNVYGPRQHPDHGVVARFVSAVTRGRRAVLRGDGKQTRDFVHVLDVADAIVRACAVPVAGRVNIASGRETSVGELHDLVAKMSGAAESAESSKLWPGEPPRMCLAVRRARDVLGWEPRIPLLVGLRGLVDQAPAQGTCGDCRAAGDACR